MPGMARKSAWTAIAAFRPCDWVTTAEASDILGKPVTPQPSDDVAGLNDPRCGRGHQARQRRKRARRRHRQGARRQRGVRIRAAGDTAVHHHRGSPRWQPHLPATAAYEFCDTVERCARTAINRIPT
jgi:hypothetical protein